MLCFIQEILEVCFMDECGCGPHEDPEPPVTFGVVNNTIQVVNNNEIVVHTGS